MAHATRVKIMHIKYMINAELVKVEITLFTLTASVRNSSV